MLKDKLFFYGKIIFALILSYGISSLLLQHVFNDYQPMIRKDLPQYIALRVTDFTSSVSGLFNKKGQAPLGAPILSELQKRATYIAPGVRASSNENAVYTEINVSQMETKVVEVTLSDGRKIRVKVPKNSNTLPPKELFE